LVRSFRAAESRFILGPGAGWYELEHLNLGFKFKPMVSVREFEIDEVRRFAGEVIPEFLAAR